MRTLLGLALVAIMVAPAAGGSFDEWLPENTIFYASVEDVSAMKTMMKDGPFGALMAEESVKEFLELPKMRLAEEMEKMTAMLGGADPMELLDVVKGQVAVAFTGLRELDGGKSLPGVVALVDVGENGKKLKEWISRVEQADDFKDKFRMIEDEFQGTRIVTWVSLDDDEAEEEEGEDEDFPRSSDPFGDMADPQPSYFIHGTTFAFASDVEVLKGILGRKGDAEAATLNGSSNYRTVRRRTGSNADMVFYLSVEEIWKLAGDKIASDPMTSKVMSALGIMDVKALGGRMTMGKTETDYHLFLYSPAEKIGLMKLLDGKNTALVPPKFVPENVASAMTMSFDVQTLWNEFKRIMGEISEDNLKQMEQGLAALKEQQGLDIEGDLVGSFGKSMTFYTFAPTPAEDDEEVTPDPMGFGAGMGRFVVAIEVADTQTMNGAIDTMLDMFPMPLETEEYMGVDIHSMNLMVVNMHMATVAGHLVIATEIDDLRAVVQTQGKDIKGLAGTEAFARGLANLPANRSMVAYSDPRQSMDMISTMMKAMGAGPAGAEMSEWVDMSLFPPAEILQKYVDVGGQVMVTEEDGVSILGISRAKMPK